MTISAAQVSELRELSGGAGMMDCKKALVEANGDMQKAIEILRKAGITKANKKAGRIAADGGIFIKVNENKKIAVIIEVNCETDFVAKDTHFNQFAKRVSEKALEHQCSDLAALANLTEDGKTLEELRKELVAKVGENIQLRRIQLIVAKDNEIIATYSHGARIGAVVRLSGDDGALGKEIAMHVVASHPQAIAPEQVSAEVIAKEREIYQAQAEKSGKPADIVKKMIEGRVQKFLKEVSLINQPFIKDPNQTVNQLLEAAGAKVIQFVRYEVGEGIEKATEDFAKEVMAQVKGDT